ncbi:hypothetical protein [Falsiroseomonas selenitidurans]|uniref:Uncharacterized protein n=1 Tax=Falsiroseomonas selenitidurans TaxID=2716335 RepID=A0ABX1E0K4_9PROT|nr:hypothetical protein [Falsiroseomonas selenitidurans]NKC30684.1 hypothetical protein [Falsiroseomonas selenitidurans]
MDPEEAPKEALIRDLLAWLAPAPRPYAEVMEAWRTSCPRLTVWEDATERGLIACETRDGGLWVAVTPAGRAVLGATPATPP